MTAPESVVRSVQEALGCEERGGKHRYCYWHGGTEGLWTERGCSVAVRAADAAWAAAYPAALRDAGVIVALWDEWPLDHWRHKAEAWLRRPDFLVRDRIRNPKEDR